MSVPALSRGLRIVEMAVKGGGVRFSEVCREFAFPKASAARLLNELLELSYLVKDADSGLYLPGPKLDDIFPYRPLPDRLYRVGEPLLKRLCDATGNTVLLVYWNGQQTQILAKESHPASVAMQKVGQIRDDLYFYPWGWIFLETVSEEAKNRQRDDCGFSDDDMKLIDEATLAYHRDGFVFERKIRRTAGARFAAPILLNDEIIGAVGMGCAAAPASQDEIIQLGEQVRDEANSISARLLRRTTF